MNVFIKNKFNKILEKANSEKFKEYITKTAEILSDVGVSDEYSLRKFHHISQYVPIFVRRALGYGTNELYAKVGINLYNKYPQSINSPDDVKNKVMEVLSEMKLGYPIGDLDVEPIKKYDVNKWLTTANEVYLKMRLYGVDKNKLIMEATQEWSEMEREKFKDWLRFYEQGGNSVYKTAQMEYMNEHGYSIPMINSNNNVLKIEPIPGLIPDSEYDQMENKESDEFDVRKIEKENFKKVRSGILSRIHSAKKILSSEIGRNFVGLEYERLLESLLNLEKDILMISCEGTCEAVVAREHNSLVVNGFEKAAGLLVKIAQMPGLPGMPAPQGAAPQGDPAKVREAVIKTLEEFGVEGITEESTVPQEQPPPAQANQPQPAPAQANKPQTTPQNAVPPPPQPPPKKAENTPSWVIKNAEIDHLESIAINIGTVSKGIRKLAQLTDPAKPGIIQEDIIEKAFANVTVMDIVKRLQALSKVFKNREIARQLGIIDLMLDKLGIAGLFPQLAEATKSALESNQYSSIRIEEILSKLMSMVDESGKVNVNITDKGKEDSIIDKEMQEALKQNELLAETPTPTTEELIAPITAPVELPKVTPPLVPPAPPNPINLPPTVNPI